MFKVFWLYKGKHVLNVAMILNYITSEIRGLKEKQAHVLQQISNTQRELQRLQDTNLVVSGALQALNHVLEEYNKTSRLPTIPEHESTFVSSQEPVFLEEKNEQGQSQVEFHDVVPAVES